MISSNDFKTGMTINYEGNIYSIIDFLHVKPGKGGAFVRSKLRNLRTGSIVDITFNAAEKMPIADIVKTKMAYLYNSLEACVFMNQESYEQIEIPNDRLKNELMYMYEGMEVEVVSFNDEILGVNLPDKVSLEITKCDPAVRGDTKTSALKDAFVSTGLLVKVPMFIEQGEKIIVSTATGKYDGRA